MNNIFIPNASPPVQWLFSYDQIGPSQDIYAVTGITFPTGKREAVSYDETEGMQFPAGLRQNPLPRVVTYREIAGMKQPDTIHSYEYTSNNYLGWGEYFGVEDNNDDYLLGTLTDYVYGSTETIQCSGKEVKIVRNYNNYHLQTLERMYRGDCTLSIETCYYAKNAVYYDDQPPQCQLPIQKTETWESSGSRQQVKISNFDASGNPILQVDSDGATTEFTWYAAEGEEGCPKEPNNFVRFMKSQTKKPRKSDYDTEVKTTYYTYKNLGNTEYIVQNSRTEYSNAVKLSENIMDYSDKNDSEFGREIMETETLFDEANSESSFISTHRFDTFVEDFRITQKSTITGHDGSQSSSSRQQSVSNGVLLSKTNAQGVNTIYTYDEIGRPLTKMTAPETAYERITRWAYSIDNGEPVTTETDAYGCQKKTFFDGYGRENLLQYFDADSEQWYDVRSTTYNELGNPVTVSRSDWQVAGSVEYSIDETYAYDNWDYVMERSSSNGVQIRRDRDPVKLSSNLFVQGGPDEKKEVSGSLEVQLDMVSRMPVKKTLKNISGVVEGEHCYEWDGLDRLCLERDELGHEIKRTYDAYNRVLTQTLPDGTVLTRTYAPHLKKSEDVASISVTGPDRDGKIQTWLLGTQKFDGLGRLIQRDSGGRTTTYVYQGAAHVPTQVTTASGAVIRYTYIAELDNAVSSVVVDGNEKLFTYDSKTAELLTAIEGGVKNIYTWNSCGALQAESFERGGTARTTEYTRTLAGKLISYTDITNKKIEYTLDKHGYLVSVMDDAMTVSLEYDALSRVSQWKTIDRAAQSEMNIALQYDDFNREIMRTIIDGSGAMLSLSQTWLPNGLMASRTTQQKGETIRDEYYDYDSRNRLIHYKVSGTELPPSAYGHDIVEQTYCYDALNNLTTVTTQLIDGSSDTAVYHYENTAEPTQLTSLTHTHADFPKSIVLEYDKNGCLIQDEAGRTLAYDPIGRLIAVTGEGISGSYGYDALNHVISQNVGGDDFRLLYYRDGELVNETLTENNEEIRLIKLGHNCVGASDNSGVTLIAGDRNSSLLWSRIISQSNGKVHSWSPYGHGDNTDRLPGFNGERVDPVNGSYHLGNGYRAYNPVLMRFNCPDSLSPFGPGGINPYAYCNSDPINHVDPSGHMSGAAIAGIVMSSVAAGVLAILTFGIATPAVAAAESGIISATTTGLLAGTDAASLTTGIVSGVLEDSKPEVASVLGWISLGTGLVGIGGSVLKAAQKVPRILERLNEGRSAVIHEALEAAPRERSPSPNNTPNVAASTHNFTKIEMSNFRYQRRIPSISKMQKVHMRASHQYIGNELVDIPHNSIELGDSGRGIVEYVQNHDIITMRNYNTATGSYRTYPYIYVKHAESAIFMSLGAKDVLNNTFMQTGREVGEHTEIAMFRDDTHLINGNHDIEPIYVNLPRFPQNRG